MSTSISGNNRIAKNTGLLYARSVFLLLISLYTTRVIIHSLGVTDYGIYNVVGGVVGMFSMLSSTMASVSRRFITFTLGENNFDKLRNTFATSITLHVIFGLLVVALLEILGVWFLYNKLHIPQNRIDIAFWVFQFSISTLFVNIISIPYDSIIIAHERMSAFAYISILSGLLKLFIAFSLKYATVDKLILYSILLFCVAVLIRSIYCIYSHRNFQETRNTKLKIHRGIFNEMFSFASWNFLGNCSFVLRNQGVEILLNMFFGVTINAAKGICGQVESAIFQFVSNFQTAVNPQLTKSVAQGDFFRTHTLIIQGGRFSFYLLTLLSVPIIIDTHRILSIWLVEIPLFTVEFVRWTIIYLLWDTLSRFLINTILAYGKIRNYELIVGGIKLMVLPLAYIWLKFGGSPLVGIWVNIIIEIVCLFVRLKYNNKMIEFPWKDYLIKVILLCWFVFVVILLCSYLIRILFDTNVFVNALLSLIISVIIIYFIGINSSEKHYLYEKFILLYKIKTGKSSK